MIKILQNLCSARRRKSGKQWFLSFNVELKVKLIAKNFVLSYEDEITSGPFMIVDADALPLFRILFKIF